VNDVTARNFFANATFVMFAYS